jgi:hypothetical protein
MLHCSLLCDYCRLRVALLLPQSLFPLDNLFVQLVAVLRDGPLRGAQTRIGIWSATSVMKPDVGQQDKTSLYI